MAKIIVQPDCGNAPRKLFLKDLHTAYGKGDLDFIGENIPDMINWNIVGRRAISGKDNYLQVLKTMPTVKVKELLIETIITHGPDASVSGQIITARGAKLAFCDIYRFKGAGGFTINSIATFIIELT